MNKVKFGNRHCNSGYKKSKKLYLGKRVLARNKISRTKSFRGK